MTACAIAVGVASASTVVLPVSIQSLAAAQSARAVVRPTPLCTSARSVTYLTVRRTRAFPQDHFRFSFPAEVVVGTPGAARRVARELCALPEMPTGALHCPADFGITYHLRFSRGHESYRVVNVDATGCQTVRGLAKARWVARSPKFWRVLGVAMHLEHPSWAAFRGSGPGG
ncbi:MAG: hypothetical protein ACRDXC_03145 [Acidimicrobiales bacterium]